MTCMHLYLVLKIGSLSLMLHCHRVPLFAIQSLLSFFNSLANLSLPYVSPLLKYKCSAHPGCMWWLLLSLFIKHDDAPKCGIAYFIMKEFNKSFTSWILSRTALWLAVLNCQSATKLPSVELYSSNIWYH